MIPIVWFLLFWIAAVGLFFLLAFFTVILALRFGLSGSKTLVLCGGFLIVGLLVVGNVALYALGVDWSQPLSLTPGSAPIGDPFLLR